MATVRLLTDAELSPEARAVFDEIRAARKTDHVNDFWRALAHDPVSLRRRDERRQAWKRLLAAHECRPVFVDLERDDATEAGRRVREALDRRIAQPVSA